MAKLKKNIIKRRKESQTYLHHHLLPLQIQIKNQIIIREIIIQFIQLKNVKVMKRKSKNIKLEINPTVLQVRTIIIIIIILIKKIIISDLTPVLNKIKSKNIKVIVIKNYNLS